MNHNRNGQGSTVRSLLQDGEFSTGVDTAALATDGTADDYAFEELTADATVPTAEDTDTGRQLLSDIESGEGTPDSTGGDDDAAASGEQDAAANNTRQLLSDVDGVKGSKDIPRSAEGRQLLGADRRHRSYHDDDHHHHGYDSHRHWGGGGYSRFGWGRRDHDEHHYGGHYRRML